jgi:acetylornithine/succinyldiaminopimelate/putrescine aminotransferase
VLNTGAGHEPALLEVYAHMPVRPVMGAGSWLVDENGERWLDAYGGHAVSSTGHSHPMVVAAIAEQAARLLFYSSAVPLAVREELAEALVARAPRPLDRVFFCNSGAEANENALHLARRWTGRQDVVTVTGGWHGRTVATLACCDGERYEAGAARAGMPLSRRARFNDVDDLRRVVGAGAAAVLLEPVQGMSGARTATREFLEAAREVCDATRTALVFDEVQCGVGRCGAFTAAEATGVTPDIITMAKGLGSGLPVAAMLSRPSLTSVLGLGDLGSTFGGGPVPCAAALATLQVIDAEGLIENAMAVGDYLRAGATGLGVTRVHGRGLLLGLELDRPAREVQQALFERRILTGTSTDPRTLRLLPPLVFSREEAGLLVAALSEVLS